MFKPKLTSTRDTVVWEELLTSLPAATRLQLLADKYLSSLFNKTSGS